VSPLYAIVDVDVCARVGRAAADLARDYLAGGVRLLQVRAKHFASGAFLQLVEDVAAQARATGATVIVNDRVDVAAAAGLGVHLGQDDLPVAAARALLGPRARIGLSTHTTAQLTSALHQPVSYVAFGPVFVTGTKANPDPVVGLHGVTEAARAAQAAGVPLVAIGGITLATAASVLGAGASSVAIIADLLAGPEPPTARVRRFIQALDPGPPV
jgi:thiamine-phosphate pyrophosphorylase